MPNDISVTKNTTPGSERWDVTYTVDQASTISKTLDTAETILDRDIKVSITTPAGSASTPTTTITANPSISVSSGGLITASANASQSITPTVSAGYVSSGTSGTVSVSGSNTSQLTTLGATTYHPSTTNQTITSGKYITGTQTINAVTISGLSAENIVSGVTVKIGDSDDDDCVASVTGTAVGGVVITQEQDEHGGIIEHITAGSIESLQSKSVTISTAGTQTITADNGYDGLSEVIVTTTGSSATEPYIEYIMNTNDYYPTKIKAYGLEGFYSGMCSHLNYLTEADFSNCPDLFSKDSEVRQYSFNQCSNLTTITGVDWSDVTSFGTYCFYNCNKLVLNLSSFTGYTNNYIYAYAFYACYRLSGTSLPSSVTIVEQYAFYNCTYLTLTSLPSSLTTIGTYAFYNCLNCTISSLPSTLSSIGSGAFLSCTGLTISALPTTQDVKINSNSFNGCTNLSISKLPSNITTQVGSQAFRGCTGLTEMEIACTSLNSQVFFSCTGLTKVWIRSTCTTISASSANNSPFSSCSTSLQIYAEPSAKLSGWGTYFNRTGANGGTTVTVVYNQATKPW